MAVVGKKNSLLQTTIMVAMVTISMTTPNITITENSTIQISITTEAYNHSNQTVYLATTAEPEEDTFSLTNLIAGTLMTLITFFGQILVFIVVSKDARLRTPSNYFIVSLALADFLISIISMPVWTIYR